MTRYYANKVLSASGSSSDQNLDFNAEAFYENLSVYIDVTVLTAGAIDYKLQAKDQISGLYVDIPGAAFTQITAIGTYRLSVGPGITTVSGKAANVLLAKQLRLVEDLTTGPATRSINLEWS